MMMARPGGTALRDPALSMCHCTSTPAAANIRDEIPSAIPVTSSGAPLGFTNTWILPPAWAPPPNARSTAVISVIFTFPSSLAPGKRHRGVKTGRAIENRFEWAGYTPKWNAMDTQPSVDITRLLQAWGNGDRTALDELTPVIYRELRRRASNYIKNERPGSTLQATALVHEAWI